MRDPFHFIFNQMLSIELFGSVFRFSMERVNHFLVDFSAFSKKAAFSVFHRPCMKSKFGIWMCAILVV